VSDRLRQDARVDEPGLVGARWWQDSVVDPVGRRTTILALLAVGGGLAVAGIAIEACEPTKTQRLGALALQRKYGWSFGAATESLVFNGVSTEPFDRDRISRMIADLAPRVPAHRPFYVQTLFESPTALPTANSEADPTPIPSLKDALQPIFTSGMRDMFKLAQGVASLLATTPGTAALVDLDGQDAVAFAAGASQQWDPVFLFDNWPHPHGVVAAHLTLAAAAYYQPLFAKAQQDAPRDSPAMFVLDRQRLAPYRDDAAQFDNRWVARMPSRDALKSLGIKRLVYIAPAPTGHGPYELDDLNDDFVAEDVAGVSIVVVDVTSLDPNHPPASSGPIGAPYRPVPRRTPFSSGSGIGVSSSARPMPSDFGSVPVAVSLVGGTLLGVAWSRSGTWNRGGGWGGG
jgi:hypothetical protein